MNATPFFSVIIPVFNAENYLRKAVESALQFHCVKEVLLIEDASPDNALALCEKLAEEDDRVKVFTHPNNENKGAGASRNLGIEKSTCDFIAFLDADDWYLPNRFDAEKELFKDINVDGVYGATGLYYQNRKSIDDKMYTLEPNIAPQDLLYEIIRPHGGEFSTNAITIKKKLFNKVGLFDTNLRLHQDSELWCRLAYYGVLINGIVSEPIAFARVHSENRISNRNRSSLNKYHTKQFFTFLKLKKTDKKVLRIMFKSYIINKSKSNNKIIRICNVVFELFKTPIIFLKLL